MEWKRLIFSYNVKCKANKLPERRRASPCCCYCSSSSCHRVITNPFCSTQWLTHSTVPERAKGFFIRHCLLNDIASSFPRRTIRRPTPLNHFRRESQAVFSEAAPALLRTSCEASAALNQPQVRVIITHSAGPSQMSLRIQTALLKWREKERHDEARSTFTASSASFVNLVTHHTTWIPSKPPPSPMRSSEIKYLRSWIYTELWESASCFSSKAHWGAVPRKRKTSSAIRECRRQQKCNVLSHRRTWYIQNNVSFFSLTLLYVGILITWSHFPPRHVWLCSYGLALALSARS